MYKTLLNLEKSFFKLRYISDREWLNSSLHDKFTECGKSGMLFNKTETIETLLSCTEDRDILIYNFEYSKVTDKCYIAHYITKNGNKKYYRTSVWVMENRLKLFYHQASTLNYDVRLIQC